jgi:hypothetical protein
MRLFWVYNDVVGSSFGRIQTHVWKGGQYAEGRLRNISYILV